MSWRWDRWAAAVLGVLAIAFAMLARQDMAFATDQNNYLGGAESLAAGKGYREAYVVGEPRCTIYPPLFPLYLSLGFRTGGPWPGSLAQVLRGQCFLAGLTAVLTYVVLRQQRITPRWASAWTLLFGASGCWHIIVNGLFSESLTQPLTLALLAWLGRGKTPGLAGCLVVGLLLAATYLTRSASTAIVGASGLVALAHARSLGVPRLAALGLPVAAAAVGWKLWTAGGGMTYASSFIEVVRDDLGISGYLRLVARNLFFVATGWDVIGALCPFLVRIVHHPILAGAGIGIALRAALAIAGAAGMTTVLLGLWSRRKQRDVWVAGIVALYLLQNMLWWYWLGDRGMLILVPIFIVWAHAGTRRIGEWTGRTRLLRRVAALAMATGILVNATFAIRIGQGTARAAERAEIESAGRWVRDHAGTNDVVVAASDIPLPHFTHAAGRPVVGVARSQIAVVPGVTPTLAIVRTAPNRYMPQPGSQGETLFISDRETFAVRRVTR